MSTLQTLQDILVTDYKVPRDQVTPAAPLTTVGLDSLSVLELMFTIEDRFKVKIVDDPPKNLVTIDDVVGFIDALLVDKATADAQNARLSA